MYSLIDVRYNSPLISERECNNQNVVECKQYPMRHPLFCEYPIRLSTFRNWRHHPDPRSLAANGFFYQGIEDTVICHFCGVALMHWDPDDDVLLEHLHYSPNCGYLMKSLGARTIQQYLDQRNDGVTTGAYNIAKPQTQGSRSSAEVFVQNSRTPRSPSYQFPSVRVSTFSKYPNYKDMHIQDLANAGFYYTGVNDIVRSSWCDLGLKEWEFRDDPYWEHAKYLPECNHPMTVKGQQFIAHVQGTYEQNLKEVKVSSSPVENSGAAGGAKERNHIRHDVVNALTSHLGLRTETQRNMIDVLDTPAAESVLEHGYTKEIVLAAVRKLKSRGQSFPTAMQILDIIFHAEESGIDLITQDLIGLDLQNVEVVKESKDDESSTFKTKWTGNLGRFIHARPTNKCSISAIDVSVQKMMYPRYSVDSTRLESFNEWPPQLKQRPADLAAAGFYYTGSGDYVRCFFCGGGLTSWQEEDDPWKEHAKWYPDCDFLKQCEREYIVTGVNLRSEKTLKIEKSNLEREKSGSINI